MDGPLDDAEFLIRSANRVRVLELLVEGSRERRDLQDNIGVTRVTMGRLLSDLEDRWWVERHGHEYHITPLGRIVIEDFEVFLDTVGTARQLRDLVPHIPTEELPFDLRQLGNAEVVRVKRSDTDAPERRMSDLIQQADELRVLSYLVMEAGPRAAAERAKTATNPAEAVFSTGVVNAVRESPRLSRQFRRMLEAGDRVYHYEDEILHAIILADEFVLYFVTDSGNVIGVFVIADETVFAWAEETYERHKHDAERLSADMFMAGDSGHGM